MLYFSRFLRHDPFALLGALLLFIAVVRYIERPDSRWLILAVASVGYVLTTHEVSFVNLFILGTFTGLLIIYRVLPAAFVVGGAALLAIVASRSLLHAAGVESVPEIPWQSPSYRQVMSYLWSVLIHPQVVVALVILLVALAVCLWLIERRRGRERGSLDGTLGSAPVGTTAWALRVSLRDRVGWLAGFVAGSAIFIALYTSMFSNLRGLGSGTIGALGYWLAQHDVQRGAQPWFYYLVLTPQYEYAAVLGLIAGLFWLAVYAWRRRRANLETDLPFYTMALLAYWAVVMFLILSWAGEKMPWLIVHFVLPALILAGGLLGRGIEWLERQPTAARWSFGRDIVRYGGALAAFCVASFLLLAWATAGPYVEIDGTLRRSLRVEPGAAWWSMYLPVLGALAVGALATARAGVRRAGAVLTVTLTGLLVLLQVHAGWSFVYRSGDVPRDMLVYVQTSPHLKQMVRDLEGFSQEWTGGVRLEVWYDGGTQWPLNWYLREFPNRRLFYDLPEEVTAPIVIAAVSQHSAEREERLADYTYTEYPMRWWIPEAETYRRFAIAPELNAEFHQNHQTDQPPPYSAVDVLRSVWNSISSLSEPRQQAKLFRLVVYRELTASIGSYNYRVYVHNDYVHYYNTYRYGYQEPE
jgi:uncharacterized protein (TIGR03663 family)